MGYIIAYVKVLKDPTNSGYLSTAGRTSALQEEQEQVDTQPCFRQLKVWPSAMSKGGEAEVISHRTHPSLSAE
ncbi:unnamed protein product [Danaus chrysippus]|uniref:(African queen) hypothetical protein n=1 Tax=Danaus chrysippus TaxID=151541 RepID=A0A8J2QZJ3_9NEOP|nr:unnamed protein product [Danaus chrysippus]